MGVDLESSWPEWPLSQIVALVLFLLSFGVAFRYFVSKQLGSARSLNTRTIALLGATGFMLVGLLLLVAFSFVLDRPESSLDWAVLAAWAWTLGLGGSILSIWWIRRPRQVPPGISYIGTAGLFTTGGILAHFLFIVLLEITFRLLLAPILGL